MNDKFCPIFTLAVAIHQEVGRQRCFKDECAWYEPEYERCGLCNWPDLIKE